MQSWTRPGTIRKGRNPIMTSERSGSTASEIMIATRMLTIVSMSVPNCTPVAWNKMYRNSPNYSTNHFKDACLKPLKKNSLLALELRLWSVGL